LWLSVPFNEISLPFDLAPFFPSVEKEAFVPNLAMILTLAMCLYYCTLDILVGTLLYVLLFTFCIVSNVIVSQSGVAKAFWFGLFLQIIGWGSQVVIGHGYFEGRKPAITDSLFQAIVSPFFLVLELLFMFGYRPQLAKEIEKRVHKKISEWKAGVQKKR